MVNFGDKNCLGCHFLECGHNGKKIPAPSMLRRGIINSEENSHIRYMQMGYTMSFGCHRGIWDTELDSRSAWETELIQKNRGACLRWPFTEQMTFETAKELQQRAHDERALTISRRALWVTVAALILNALIELIRLIL